MIDNYFSKIDHLKNENVFNANFKDVKDELFVNNDFFDPYDLIQVKYEMIRRVKQEGWTISKAAQTFGISRISFYKLLNIYNSQGLVGFFPKKRGPKKPHKINDNIALYINNYITNNEEHNAAEITNQIKTNFNITLHKRSIQRFLSNKKKLEGK